MKAFICKIEQTFRITGREDLFLIPESFVEDWPKAVKLNHGDLIGLHPPGNPAFIAKILSIEFLDIKGGKAKVVLGISSEYKADDIPAGTEVWTHLSSADE